MSKLEKLIAQYPITLYPEPEGGYTVMIVDLVGCLSQGDTLEEAVTNIQEAKHAWLETAWECGDDIPLPDLQIKNKSHSLAIASDFSSII